ncbi:cytochrome c oxidase subunit 4 [Desulfobaculum xiamenense]|uniref:Cytochrome c oxidase subunit 4 n=1 Tax=Desulfobaculum xiamenense TaxID=995050 RepID=A0A846QNI7_9BACT|nr:cytochrome C oxidase subunit IV family protein [Desulfobaculum xiamenense]NJB67833.1 cytochrome c oxidase subunit 4 [Desulfobaculum xiamenense]
MDDGGRHHVLPYRLLVGVWGGLLTLTGITVWASTIDFGFLNVVIALTIATSKALLVVLVFMHLRYENRTFHAMVLTAFVILAIFIGFTFFDTAYR